MNAVCAIQKLFTLLSTASLLAGLLVPLLYVVERRRADAFNSQATDPVAGTWRAWTLLAGRSGFHAYRQSFSFDVPERAAEYAGRVGRTIPDGHVTTAPQPNPFGRGASFWNRFGFGYRLQPPVRETAGGGCCRTSEVAHVPYWAVSALFLACGVRAVRHGGDRLRLAWRRGAGHCSACGYDLRATPDRCPECGATFEHAR